MANDKIYFRGDISDASKFEMFWAHNDCRIITIDSLEIIVSAHSGTTALLHYGGGGQELCDVVPAPATPTPVASYPYVSPPPAPAQPLMSTSPVTMKMGQVVRFTRKDIGAVVIIRDPGLSIDTLGILNKTNTSISSDKIEVLITAGFNKGATWVGPAHLVFLAGGVTQRKFNSVDIGAEAYVSVAPNTKPVLCKLIDIDDSGTRQRVRVTRYPCVDEWVYSENVEHRPIKPPLGKCSECSDTGFVDLFTGPSPCSKGCKP